MQDPPLPTTGNVPHENPLFGDTNDNILRDPPAPQLPANEHILITREPLEATHYQSITRSAITVNNFEIKQKMIQIIQNNLQFRGTMIEDPN
ncbi:hypothetical protein EPI10_020386 [Gossypium australe]|uniref:Uncharacterized protein n=1 Tax=Gossypium australe TaxID=47621 RepID=A0A5B6WGD8_9ROSI|nr:hypothetical protein EPI10_020386 [Gossypium australe]